MGRLLAWTFLALWSATPPTPASAAEPMDGELMLVDRVVAAVDGDPIFLSDVERAIALGLAEPEPEEGERELRRRVLDGLIEQRLRFHEVERYETGPLAVEELEEQVARIRDRYPDDAAFQARLAELGLDEEGLRHLLARQLRVLRYVGERLGPRIFVEADEIREYYEGELSARAEAEGVALPPLDQIRSEVRGILRARRLNEEIERWTDELRWKAEVVDYFDRPERQPPPVVHRFGVDG
jgi:hypothetical protein